MLMEVAGTNIWQKAVIFRTSLEDNKVIVYFNSISKELSMVYQICKRVKKVQKKREHVIINRLKITCPYRVEPIPPACWWATA
jgi:hypothetical protein